VIRRDAEPRYKWRMTSTALSTFSSEMADLVARASALVVSVDGRHHRPGSGIIIGTDLVVTADHVLEREDGLTVRVDERRLPATIAGRDPASDIAVLRVPGLGGAELGRIASELGDEPRVGHVVVSVSRTASGNVSAGLGIINALGGPLRTARGITLTRVMRTDAAARPGTSGGAIVDAAGRVIAMTTSALLRGLPVGIPIGQLSEIAAALASNRPVKRAYLGVSVQPVRFPKPGPEGVEGGLLVSGIAPEGAADRGGLLVGDVIVAFNGARLAHADDLQDKLAAAEAGAAASLSAVRGGALQRIDVTVGVRPSA
jgi:S1-C subfamily serine protease